MWDGVWRFSVMAGRGAVSAGPSPSQVWVLGVYWDRFRNGRVSDAERWPITTLLYFSTLSDNDGLTKGMNYVCHDQWFFGVFRENGVCRGKMELALTTGGGNWELGIKKSWLGKVGDCEVILRQAAFF